MSDDKNEEKLSNVEKLSKDVEEGLKEMNTRSSRSFFDRLRNLFGSVTQSISKAFQEAGLVEDAESGHRLIPKFAGGLAAIGGGLLTHVITGRFLKDVPILGSLLTGFAALVSAKIGHRMFEVFKAESPDAHLPVGAGTVRAFGKDVALEQKTTRVTTKENDEFTTHDHDVPAVNMDAMRIGKSWKNINKLKIRVEEAAKNVKLGAGSVEPLSKDAILAARASEDMAEIVVSYQNWEETMRRLNIYTDDYTQNTRREILHDLREAGLDEYDDLEALIPTVPVVPTLRDPSKDNKWQGNNDLLATMNANGPKAIKYLKENVAGMGHLKESEWEEMNVSEKINLLKRYGAELKQDALTHLDGTESKGVYETVSRLSTVIPWAYPAFWTEAGEKANRQRGAIDNYNKVIDSRPVVAGISVPNSTDIVDGATDTILSTLGLFNEETLNSPIWEDYSHRLKREALRNALKNTNKKQPTWQDYSSALQTVIEDADFQTPAMKDKAKQVLEYARFKERLEPVMQAFDREIHQPNREKLEAMQEKGGALDQYNEKVERFQQSMQLLEKDKVLLTVAQNPAIDMEMKDRGIVPHKGKEWWAGESLRLRDVSSRDSIVSRMGIRIAQDKVIVDMGDRYFEENLFVIDAPGIDAKMGKGDMADVYKALKPHLEQAKERYYRNLDQPGPHLYAYQNRVNENGSSKEWERLRAEMEDQVENHGMDRSVARKKLESYLKENPLYQTVAWLDNRPEGTETTEMRGRYTEVNNNFSVEHDAKHFQISKNGGQWFDAETIDMQMLGNPYRDIRLKEMAKVAEAAEERNLKQTKLAERVAADGSPHDWPKVKEAISEVMKKGQLLPKEAEAHLSAYLKDNPIYEVQTWQDNRFGESHTVQLRHAYNRVNSHLEPAVDKNAGHLFTMEVKIDDGEWLKVNLSENEALLNGAIGADEEKAMSAIIKQAKEKGVPVKQPEKPSPSYKDEGQPDFAMTSLLKDLNFDDMVKKFGVSMSAEASKASLPMASSSNDKNPPEREQF